MNNCMVHLRSDIVDIVIAGRSEGLVACFKLELTPQKFYVDLSNFKIMALWSFFVCFFVNFNVTGEFLVYMSYGCCFFMELLCLYWASSWTWECGCLWTKLVGRLLSEACELWGDVTNYHHLLEYLIFLTKISLSIWWNFPLELPKHPKKSGHQQLEFD